MIYKVDMIFCAHEHYYEHNTVCDLSEIDTNQHKIHIIITGGGGVPLRDLPSKKAVENRIQNYAEEGFSVHCVKQQKVYHYCRVNTTHDPVVVEILDVTEIKEKSLQPIDIIRISKRSSREL